ncbi:MAG: hypothetical protein KC442_13730 [Thermomicrobiales bacterium]|nr:hypothetical protein [Thermomicrobiales bacterium]
MAGAVTPFPAIIAFPSPATPPAPYAPRCAFAQTRDQWILQSDCELSAALDLPAHVTLDGGGHTMTLAGDAESFESAAIRGAGGVVNLTVDGSHLLPLAPTCFAAITLAAPARIAHTTVRNIQFGDAGHTAIGIEIAAFDGAATLVHDVALENISGAGLYLTGNGKVRAERVSSSVVTVAVQATGNISATLRDVAVEDAQADVLAQDQSRVRIQDSRVTGEHIAADQAIIHQGAVTFIGAGVREQARRPTAASAAAPHDLLG